jgi:hypothetical protein
MIGPLAKFIDWSALQMVYTIVPRSEWKLEEALEFLNEPDFIPDASDPAQIEFDGPRHFRFPRRARAKSRGTTSFMAASIGARTQFQRGCPF